MKCWEDMLQATTAEFIAWATDEPWASEMKACQQDANWHAEGDVWTHTLMVIRECERLEEWASLSREDQVKLLLTACFHDAGKPRTTQIDPETGRTHSPKHALIGMEIGRAALRELNCPIASREEILQLVRYRGRPRICSKNPTQQRRSSHFLGW